MALFVSLEDKEGDTVVRVFEIRSIQRRFASSEGQVCLPFISETEDSAFNQAQLPHLVSELGRLSATELAVEERSELDRLLSACDRIKAMKGASIHFYVDSGGEA